MSGIASATSTLRHNLKRRGSERLRGFHVAVGHARDRGNHVRVDERHAGDEDEHHLLRLVDPEPQNGQGNQRRHGQIPPEQREGRSGRLDDAPGSGQDAEGHADEGREAEPDQHPLQGCRDAFDQRAILQEAGEASDHFRGARQDDGRYQPLLGSAASGQNPPDEQYQSHRPHADEAARHRGRRESKREK